MDAPAQPWRQAYPTGIAWDMALPRQTLPEVFEAAAARFADRPALDFLGRRWRYAALGDAVARLAEGLRRQGVGPGLRVGLCLPNSPWYVVACFAVLRTGATVVNFNPLHPAGELATQARDAEVTLLVAPDLDPILPRVLGLLGEGPVRQVLVCRFATALPAFQRLGFALLKRRSLAAIPDDPRVLRWEALAAVPPIATPCPARPEDLAVLQYTGGTTGTPKAAMLSHANLTANLAQVVAWSQGCRPGEERMLAVLPFFHVFALTAVLNAGIAMGAELVLLPRFVPAQLLATLRRTRPTLFHGVPTLFQAVLDHGATAADLASVRLCISGGAPLPQALQQRFEATSGARLVEGYGLTEAAPVCFCNPVEGGGKPGSIGLPLPGITAEIRALEPPGHALSPGQAGELCVAGPNVMQGYWRRPEESDAVLGPDGFLRTGDVGVMDAAGYVTLIDRIKDLILCSGYNVYPRMIEEALHAHPDVAAATVVGEPDRYRGEHPVAFVELRAGATADAPALMEFLDGRLSPIERPARIELRAALPRTAVGKLSKKELKAELLARGGA